MEGMRNTALYKQIKQVLVIHQILSEINLARILKVKY